MNSDPTTSKDAVGYVVAQAMHGSPNGREAALIDKCADYLRGSVSDLAEAAALLRELEWDGGADENKCGMCGATRRRVGHVEYEGEHQPLCRLAAFLARHP